MSIYQKMNKQVFISNRKHFFDLMDNESFAIFSAKNAAYNAPLSEFIQNENFYYLTGLKVPNAILLLYKKGKREREFLFIERNIEEYEPWIGKKMSKEEAQEISGIKNVFLLDRFEEYLHIFAQESKIFYCCYETSPINANLSNEVEKLNQIKQHYPALTIKKADIFLKKLRMKKSKEEIENIKKAISYTKAGIESIIEHTKPEIKESELEAYFTLSACDEVKDILLFHRLLQVVKMLQYCTTPTTMQKLEKMTSCY